MILSSGVGGVKGVIVPEGRVRIICGRDGCVWMRMVGRSGAIVWSWWWRVGAWVWVGSLGGIALVEVESDQVGVREGLDG